MLSLGLAGSAAISPAETRVVTSIVHTDAQTGKLVRTTVTSSSPSATSASKPQNLKDIIESAAAKNEVEAPLVYSVIRAESNYNPVAVSNKGAQGLMQLIPATAKRFGVKDSFDSKDNVEGGVKYLRYLIDLFHGDYARAVAAYNAGEAAVSKYGGVPPYKETQNYVAQVVKQLAAERRAFSEKPAIVAEAASVPAESTETSSPVIASFTADGRVYYRTP